MEFFRWILVLTGLVLLGAAYFLGRKKARSSVHHRPIPEAYDPSVDELSVPIGDLPQNSFADSGNTGNAVVEESDVDWRTDEPRDAQTFRSSGGAFLSDEEIDATLPPSDGYGQESVQAELDISEQFDEVNYSDRLSGRESNRESNAAKPGAKSFASAVKQAADTTPQASNRISSSDEEADRNFAEEFETYQEEPVVIEDFEEKLVTIHVVAQRDQRFFGRELKPLFEQHGYQYGRMSLYHCKLDSDKVFSIANMVKPGTFDEKAMENFATPGITLFMRLPIELDADVAFDFLIREAQELAEELGGTLRDGNRNPLSDQTIQHMREDIQQYVFRSKRVMQPA